MSNFRPVASIPDPLAAILNRDSESGVRLIQTAIFMAGKSTHPIGNSRIRPMRLLLLLGAATLALANATPAAAQQIETPVAFDSAGKVRSLTPQLVSRYGLVAPAWPVQGTFVEARLFSVSGGAHVLTIERPGGAVERYSLAEAEVSAIRASVDAAMTLTGGTPVEAGPHVIAAPEIGGVHRGT